MEIARDRLQEHLERIHAGGQFPEAAFQPDLSVIGRSASGSTYIFAPPLVEADQGIREPFAIGRMEQLIAAVRSMAGSESALLRLELTGGRLVVRGASERSDEARLPALRPKSVGTYMNPEGAEGLREKLEQGDAVRLPWRHVTGIPTLHEDFGQDGARLEVKGDGADVHFGSENATYYRRALPGLGYDGPPCEVGIESVALAAVLRTVPDENVEVDLTLTGTDDHVGISTSDGYVYALAPDAR